MDSALAWYWHKKKPTSQKATAVILSLALAVAAGEGYLVGRQFGVKSYTYLQQGNAQYRVDSAAGRTDRLTTSGWEPVSFDRLPESLQLKDFLVSLRQGERGANEICFEASNDSNDVLQDITIVWGLNPAPVGGGNPIDAIFDPQRRITLKRAGGGYLDVGKTSLFCRAQPRPLPNGSTWTGILLEVKGWKQ